MPTLALHAADGIHHPLSSLTLSGLLDALACMQARGAGRIDGRYVLEGGGYAIEALFSDEALFSVLMALGGGDQAEAEDLEHLGVRLAG